MEVKTKDAVRHELIGKMAEIVDSKNKSDIGIKGNIIDETKTSLLIEDKNKKKQVFKKNIILAINIKDKQFKIKGERLFGKPKERIKK